MRSERGQATVEWIGLLLLVALALAALSRLAAEANGKDLGTRVAHSMTAAARESGGRPRESSGGRSAALGGSASGGSASGGSPGSRGSSAGGGGSSAAVEDSAPRGAPALRASRAVALAGFPGSLKRLGRGGRAVWRRAWFACLVYERFRYSLAHPEVNVPGYTVPYEVAARIVARCVSPVDLFRDFAPPGSRS
jgi:hypothetical protein